MICANCGRPIEIHLCGTKALPSPEQLEEIRARYESGVTMRDIAKECGVSYSYIRRRVIWSGATIRPRGGAY